MTLHFSATSFDEEAASAPHATSSSTLALLRLYTTTSCPFLRIFLLMGFPMIPKPINPTFIFSSKRSIKIKKEYNSYFYKKVIPENKKEQIDINDFLFRKN